MNVLKFPLLGAAALVQGMAAAFDPATVRPRSSGNRALATSNDDQAATVSWRDYGHARDPSFSSTLLRRRYERSGGILYRQSVLPPDEHRKVREELTALLGKGGPLRLTDETSSSVASNRVGTRLPPDCETARILASPEGGVSRLINDVVACADGGRMVLSEDVPIEVRVYEKPGAGMEWHVDDALFRPEQVEIVYTIDNNSDCVTMWEEGDSMDILQEGDDLQRKNRVEVETTANSAIIIKAGGVRHRVSPLKSGGRRVILKFVYVHEGSVFVDGAEKHLKQFVSGKNKSSRKRKGGGRR